MGTDLSLFFPGCVSLDHHESITEEVVVIIENSQVFVNNRLFGDLHVPDGFHVMYLHHSGEEQLEEYELGNLSVLTLEIQLLHNVGEDEGLLLGLGLFSVLDQVGQDAEKIRVGFRNTDPDVLMDEILALSVVYDQRVHDEVQERQQHA